MKIGFTGTRKGMSALQLKEVEEWLHNAAADFHLSVHHGICIGADVEFHSIVRKLFGPWPIIHGWPSTLSGMTGEWAANNCDKLHEPMAPLLRNLKIVESVDILLAAPFEMEEQRRGGTWSTIRAVKRRGMTEENGRLVIFLPRPVEERRNA